MGDPDGYERNRESADQLRRQSGGRAPGETRRLPGCFGLAIGAVVALFIGVAGLCSGSGPINRLGADVVIILLALTPILLVAAIIVGIYRWASRK